MFSFIRAIIPVLSLVSASFSVAQAPSQYSLDYRANANGIAAKANRSLTLQVNQSLQLSNTLEVNLGGQLVARIEQISIFEFIDNQFKPTVYSYQQTGLSQETQTVDYNWGTLVAISNGDDESWTIELSSNTFDQLSHQLALRQALMNGTTNIELAVIDEDKIEIYRYRAINEEVINTPLGAFNSTVVERIRNDEDRSTIFWLANDWEFVLIRMEQTNSGLTTVLELDEGIVEGVPIVPLN